MSTTAGQNLSLGKLKRAVSSSINVNNTANSSLGSVSGNDTNTKMSDFSIDSVDSVTGYTYLWEQTSEDYQVNFSNSGSRFNDKIASNTANFSWSFDGNLDISFGGADYIASVTAAAISNPNGEVAGTFNQSGSLKVKFAEDGQSDGFNDHATRYNTNVSKSIEIVDTYGGVPVCLLFGSPVSKSDGTVVNVEDLNIGDEILTVKLPNATDEDEGTDWKNDIFNRTGSFTQHSASVMRVLYEFSQHYYDINSGSEYITGEHHMLYRQAGSENWTWKTAPNFSVGDYLMDKNGNEVAISSLVINQDSDGYEVVQLDVEPDDYYVGSTFVVHNKGSNSEPSYPTTQWSNASGDFSLSIPDGSTSIVDNVISLLKSIQLSNGSGTTSFSCQQPSNGNVELKIAVSTTGDPGTSGTANGGTGFGNTQSSVANASTYYMRFKLVETKAAAGNLSAEARTITITNNGVSNTDIDITCSLTNI